MPLSRTTFANMRSIFDFSGENAKVANWLAERNGFELSVPIVRRGLYARNGMWD